MSIICLLFMSHFRLQDTCHCDNVNHFRWVLFICFRVASLSGRICLPQIITALRTVLFISHPDGVISKLRMENREGRIIQMRKPILNSQIPILNSTRHFEIENEEWRRENYPDVEANSQFSNPNSQFSEASSGHCG